MEKKKQQSTERKLREKHLSDIVTLIHKVSEAKGWTSSLEAYDKKDFRFATVSVWRTTPSSGTEVSGTFEIICDDQIKINYHSTSFHNYGLADLYDAISHAFYKLKLPWVKPREKIVDRTKGALSEVERIFRRFHRIVRQLKHRHDERPPFLVTDEYDVQDLVHAILKGLYDDIRPEEYCPSAPS